MWPWTDWKLRRALRRYRRERDLEAVLQMDWHRDLDLSAFFTDVEERLHGEEITRLPAETGGISGAAKPDQPPLPL